MKRLALGLVLALAALGLMASPVMAAPNAPQAAPAWTAADQVFLATLAVPAQAPAPALAATRPTLGKSTCSASADCGSGITLGCTGHNSCSAVNRNCSTGVRGSVTCDGIRVPCTNPCP
jgi:hypothetical protein